MSSPLFDELLDHGLMVLGRKIAAAPKKYPELRAHAVPLYRESDPKLLIRKLVDCDVLTDGDVHHEALGSGFVRISPTPANAATGRRRRWQRTIAGCAKRWRSLAGLMRSCV